MLTCLRKSAINIVIECIDWVFPVRDLSSVVKRLIEFGVDILWEGYWIVDPAVTGSNPAYSALKPAFL